MVWLDLTDDLVNLRLKTHVKHAISLIHDQVSHLSQVRLLCFKHVNQITWSSNDDFEASLQIMDLRAFGCPTIDDSVANA